MLGGGFACCSCDTVWQPEAMLGIYKTRCTALWAAAVGLGLSPASLSPTTSPLPPSEPVCPRYAVVIEQRHGFNKQTKALFFTDVLKSMLLGVMLLPPLVGGFTWLLQRAGPWVPIQLWAFFFTIAVVMMTVYPTCECRALTLHLEHAGCTPVLHLSCSAGSATALLL